jgi:hypothetical protein
MAPMYKIAVVQMYPEVRLVLYLSCCCTLYRLWKCSYDHPGISGSDALASGRGQIPSLFPIKVDSASVMCRTHLVMLF